MGQVLAFLLAGLTLVAPLAAKEISVPSGQPVTFQDVIWGEPGPEGLTLRFRFVAPEIARDGGSVGFDAAAQDMAYLCETFALPRIASTGPQPAQIVISLSDREVAFGEPSPESTQFFEAYRPEDSTCIWEGF